MQVLRFRLARKAPNVAQEDRSIYVANFPDIALELKNRLEVNLFLYCWKLLRGRFRFHRALHFR